MNGSPPYRAHPFRLPNRPPRQVIIGKLALPGGIGGVSDGDKDTIYVADVFAYRTASNFCSAVTERNAGGLFDGNRQTFDGGMSWQICRASNALHGTT
jgi:hypothetical protein